MSFSGVPMMIGAGFEETPALHRADLMRQLVADFVRGSEGVMRDTDLAIRAKPAPDGEVLMSVGGGVVLNRALGGDREAYYDFNDEDVAIPIPGTGSSGGRSDLVVAQVEDPWAAGTQYQVPADPAHGPYMLPRVIPNVDKRIYNAHQLAAIRSCITLARIDQPKDNRVITQAMIKDCRAIANGPQRYQEPIADLPPEPPPPILGENPWTESRIQQVSQTLNYTDRAWVNWPSSAAWRVPIPPQANGVDIYTVVENPAQVNGNCYGECVVGIDGEGSSPSFFGTPMPFDGDSISTDRPNRLPIFYSTTLRWGADPKYRGKLRTFRWRARMYDALRTRGRMVADTSTVIYIQLNFKSLPIIN